MRADPRSPHVRFHDMRHTHISQLLSGGWQITEVSQRPGHAIPAITLSIYAHAIPKADDKFDMAFDTQFEAEIEQNENGSP